MGFLGKCSILEEISQALYLEWFVRFRFPGHENVPLVPSPKGEIPQGWKWHRFGELLESMKGGEWGEETPKDHETAQVMIVRGTDFDDVAYGGLLSHANSLYLAFELVWKKAAARGCHRRKLRECKDPKPELLS